MYFVDDADAQNWTRIVLFHAVEHADPVLLWGEPVDPSIDVGLAISSQPPKAVTVNVWKMNNPEDEDAHSTGEILTIKTLFCPIDTKRPQQAEFRAQHHGPYDTVSIKRSYSASPGSS